jgi:uracil phosphoribosyltransferase
MDSYLCSDPKAHSLFLTYTLMLHNLSKKQSVINHFIAELRSVEVQTDRLRFRTNLRRLSTCIGYEISKQLVYHATDVATPLGTSTIAMCTDRIVLADILRAGLPMHEGLLDVFDRADNAFVGAYRRHHKDGSFDIQQDYLASPSVEDSVLILCDPMLATGASVRVALDQLLLHGQPKQIHIVCAIASAAAIEFVERMWPAAHIWAGAVDEELTAKGYIVPGLGDAGDLAYGTKL